MMTWFRGSPLRWLYPPVCKLCGARGLGDLDLCGACRDDLPRILRPCRFCGLPLTVDSAGPCPRCLMRPPPADLVFAPYRYAPPIDRLVQRTKFHRDLAAARLLGSLLAEAASELSRERPSLLAPVPLHPARQRSRGYNQSLELARHAARKLAIPLEPRAVVRTRDNPPQAGLSAAARRRNVRGIFEVRLDFDGERVAIVDDVLTTGSTVFEVVRSLKAAGSGPVEIWTIARAI